MLVERIDWQQVAFWLNTKDSVVELRWRASRCYR